MDSSSFTSYYQSVKMPDHINNLFYVNQVLGVLFLSLGVFWVIYVIFAVVTQVRNKRNVVALIHLDKKYDYTHRFLMQREIIFRYVLFLVIFIAELGYVLMVNVYGIADKFYKTHGIFETGSPIWIQKDSNEFSGSIILLDVFEVLGSFSFSMMIWLFGASLLHLSYSAKNELRMKTIIRFILIGIITNFIISIPPVIPTSYISLIGSILQTLINQISFFVVLHIAMKKFFPAMRSNTIDSFHAHNDKVFLNEKWLLRQYKLLICVFLVTFELYILKSVILLNLTWIYAVVSTKWYFVLSKISSTHVLLRVGYYILLASQVINCVIYLIIVLVNVSFLFFFLLSCVQRVVKKRRACYRYEIGSASLLP